jgi:dGTPase
MIHVQLVSKIGRTIGRALSLNEDLIEAGALGHDIGHVPFGHLGEFFLDELSVRYDEGHFMHNVQSVRNLMALENNGKGLNLTVQTLDAMLCHNGEFVESNYKPRKKTKEEFLQEYQDCYKDNKYNKNLVPMTLEGCVVRISDIVAYLGRDIEDAVRLGVFDKKELPKSIRDILGDSNRSIINTIIMDIINESLGKDSICMSDNIYKAIKDLKKFNYEHIYNVSMTTGERQYVKRMFDELFVYYMKVLHSDNKKTSIFKSFINKMTDDYKANTSDARKVIDYISGMTDQYFIDQYKKMKMNS